MPQRHLSPFKRRARQFVGRPAYVRLPEHKAAGFEGISGPSRRSMLAIAYTGLRRPLICVGCIVLTPSERERQRRVFQIARAYGRMKDQQAA